MKECLIYKDEGDCKHMGVNKENNISARHLWEHSLSVSQSLDE